MGIDQGIYLATPRQHLCQQGVSRIAAYHEYYPDILQHAFLTQTTAGADQQIASVQFQKKFLHSRHRIQPGCFPLTLSFL